jgi:hypothetical protein
MAELAESEALTATRHYKPDSTPPVATPADAPPAARHPLRSPFLLLPAIWFLCGLSNSLPGTASKVFRVSILRVEPEVQAVLFGALQSLPWQFKIGFAFLSDSVPIAGRRRVPYLLIALAVQLACWVVTTAVLDDISIAALALVSFVQTLAQVVIGVVTDSLIVENMTRHERGESYGNLQTDCWVALTLGGLAGQLAGLALLGGGTGSESLPGIRRCFVATTLLKGLTFAPVLLLHDPRVAFARGGCCGDGAALLGELLAAMRRRRVWMPTLFLFLYAATPGNGDAFSSWLLGDEPTRHDPQPLGFSARQCAAAAAAVRAPSDTPCARRPSERALGARPGMRSSASPARSPRRLARACTRGASRARRCGRYSPRSSCEPPLCYAMLCSSCVPHRRVAHARRAVRWQVLAAAASASQLVLIFGLNRKVGLL